MGTGVAIEKFQKWQNPFSSVKLAEPGERKQRQRRHPIVGVMCAEAPLCAIQHTLRNPERHTDRGTDEETIYELRRRRNTVGLLGLGETFGAQ